MADVDLEYEQFYPAWHDYPDESTPVTSATAQHWDDAHAAAAAAVTELGATGTAATRALRSFDTAANWAAANPVLALHERATDTTTGLERVGDGATAYLAIAPMGAAAFVPQVSPPTSYTWDATTGSIATITEHYAAPIGDRVTTYGGYNAAGDPTTETDPDGSHWLLGYDGAGNLTSRTAV